MYDQTSKVSPWLVIFGFDFSISKLAKKDLIINAIVNFLLFLDILQAAQGSLEYFFFLYKVKLG